MGVGATAGRELWKSDGTRAGTVLVKDIRPGAKHSWVGYMTEVGGTLFFTVDDGIHGEELWPSDGTEAGTVLVRDINAGGGLRVAAHGTANTRTGTLRVNVWVAGAGRLVVAPVAGSRVQRVERQLASRGATTVRLRPTKAGLRQLHRTSRLPVRVRFIPPPAEDPAPARPTATP